MIFADKYSARDKRLLRLERELNRLRRAQGHAPVIPLERPYQRGWFKTYRLREDAWHHPETLVFQAVLKVVNQVVHCANRDFVGRNDEPVALRPKIIPVSDWKRLVWPLSHQRLFAYGLWPVEDLYPWCLLHYRNSVRGFRLMRTWWLEEETGPWMITHQRVELPEVRSRIAEIEAHLRHTCGRERLDHLHGHRVHWREHRGNLVRYRAQAPIVDSPQPD
jgi:hypothetical protein